MAKSAQVTLDLITQSLTALIIYTDFLSPSSIETISNLSPTRLVPNTLYTTSFNPIQPHLSSLMFAAPRKKKSLSSGSNQAVKATSQQHQTYLDSISNPQASTQTPCSFFLSNEQDPRSTSSRSSGPKSPSHRHSSPPLKHRYHHNQSNQSNQANHATTSTNTSRSGSADNTDNNLMSTRRNPYNQRNQPQHNTTTTLASSIISTDDDDTGLLSPSDLSDSFDEVWNEQIITANQDRLQAISPTRLSLQHPNQPQHTNPSPTFSAATSLFTDRIDYANIEHFDLEPFQHLNTVNNLTSLNFDRDQSHLPSSSISNSTTFARALNVHHSPSPHLRTHSRHTKGASPNLFQLEASSKTTPTPSHLHVNHAPTSPQPSIQPSTSLNIATQTNPSSSPPPLPKPKPSTFASPKLVMPRVSLPTRRPFTTDGLALGKLKLLIAGDSGTGKSMLVKAIAQASKDIVYINDFPTFVDPEDGTLWEYEASTKPRIDFDHTFGGEKEETEKDSDLDSSSDSDFDFGSVYGDYYDTANFARSSSATTKAKSRRPSVAPQSSSKTSSDSNAFEKNVCIVDTLGYGTFTDASRCIQTVISYLDSAFHATSDLVNAQNPEACSLLASKSSMKSVPMVDACLYTITSRLKPVDIEYIRQISQYTTVIPVITRADVLPVKEVLALKLSILQDLRRADLVPYVFDTSIEEAIESTRRELVSYIDKSCGKRSKSVTINSFSKGEDGNGNGLNIREKYQSKLRPKALSEPMLERFDQRGFGESTSKTTNAANKSKDLGFEKPKPYYYQDHDSEGVLDSDSSVDFVDSSPYNTNTQQQERLNSDKKNSNNQIKSSNLLFLFPYSVSSISDSEDQQLSAIIDESTVLINSQFSFVDEKSFSNNNSAATFSSATTKANASTSCDSLKSNPKSKSKSKSILNDQTAVPSTLVSSELESLCQHLFSIYGATWLRHCAAKKFLEWVKKNNNAQNTEYDGYGSGQKMIEYRNMVSDYNGYGSGHTGMVGTVILRDGRSAVSNYTYIKSWVPFLGSGGGRAENRDITPSNYNKVNSRSINDSTKAKKGKGGEKGTQRDDNAKNKKKKKKKNGQVEDIFGFDFDFLFGSDAELQEFYLQDDAYTESRLKAQRNTGKWVMKIAQSDGVNCIAIPYKPLKSSCQQNCLGSGSSANSSNNKGKSNTKGKGKRRNHSSASFSPLAFSNTKSNTNNAEAANTNTTHSLDDGHNNNHYQLVPTFSLTTPRIITKPENIVEQHCLYNNSSSSKDSKEGLNLPRKNDLVRVFYVSPEQVFALSGGSDDLTGRHGTDVGGIGIVENGVDENDGNSERRGGRRRGKRRNCPKVKYISYRTLPQTPTVKYSCSIIDNDPLDFSRVSSNAVNFGVKAIGIAVKVFGVAVGLGLLIELLLCSNLVDTVELRRPSENVVGVFGSIGEGVKQQVWDPIMDRVLNPVTQSITSTSSSSFSSSLAFIPDSILSSITGLVSSAAKQIGKLVKPLADPVAQLVSSLLSPFMAPAEVVSVQERLRFEAFGNFGDFGSPSDGGTTQSLLSALFSGTLDNNVFTVLLNSLSSGLSRVI